MRALLHAITLRNPYRPSSLQSHMANQGGVAFARDAYFSRRPGNLRYLLKKRYEWMNGYIQPSDTVLELGAGAGFSREFLYTDKLVLSDINSYPWIDRVVDAANPELPASSVDVVICSHMIHHLSRPVRFFRDIYSSLRPGGRILIQEINTSVIMRVLLRIMRHEGWSYDVDVFDDSCVCNDPADPWSANCAIPQMLFEDVDKFCRAIPYYRVVRNELSEFLLFPLSGGVIAKSPTINMPLRFLRCVDKLDSALIRLFPSIVALGRRVVLVKDERLVVGS